MKNPIILSVLVLFLVSNLLAQKVSYKGVEFMSGNTSFADRVVSYNKGTYAKSHVNPSTALGAPDYVNKKSQTYVSLGNGGTLILQFTDNSLTPSGDSEMDLWIFEIGEAVEDTDVYISKNGSSWISVGKVNGSKSGIDIDKYIGKGVELGERYSFVKIVDIEKADYSKGETAGADIDAIGAISSDVAVPQPGDTTPGSGDCYTKADLEDAYNRGYQDGQDKIKSLICDICSDVKSKSKK